MAIITILGLIKKTQEEQRATYTYDNNLSYSLKKERYTNMLPLLLDNFEDRIIPIYTKDAKSFQQEVLMDEFNKNFEDIFQKEYFIEDVDEEGYAKTFKIINDAINEDEENIIDLSHGFRHLPILATISLIVNNIENTNKIKHIFFAKEITPREEYKIIDLKNYLELANISYLLSTFNQNYTVSGNMTFTNPLYQELADELKKFSEHFLSNSLKVIIEGDMIDNIFKTFDKLEKEDDVSNLNSFTRKIRSHLRTIQGLKNMRKEHEKFYALSKIMDKRGYQLNAITLLFEALGYYCLDSIYQNTDKAKAHIDEFKNFIEEKKQPRNVYSDYTLTDQSRNIIKLKEKFSGKLLYKPKHIKDEVIDYIDYLDNILKCELNPKRELNFFISYIYDMELLRNNLTHGNSGDEVKNIEKLFKRYIDKFDDFIKKQDILKPKT